MEEGDTGGVYAFVEEGVVSRGWGDVVRVC